jgi:predicted Zn-dependent peptidase
MSVPATSDNRILRAPPLGPERPVSWARRSVRTLSNGLEVVVAESKSVPKVSAQLFMRSGNAVVAHRSPGLADMTAAVVRTGTESRPSRRIEEDLRRMGGDMSTNAGADSSAIGISGLAEFSQGLLDLMADLARNATLPVAEFERERSQHLEELRIDRTTPGFLGSECLRRVLFGAHPYGIIAPTEEQVKLYTRDALAEFYRTYYVPAESVLLVVGDVDSNKIIDQVEQAFGSWKAPMPLATPRPAPPELTGRRVHLVHLPGTVQTDVLVGNRAITRTDPNWMRMVLTNSIYGGAFHSRLVMNIREQKGYTYSPRSSAVPLRQHGYFAIHAAVRNDVVAASLAEIFYELDRMRALPVGDAELDDARNYLSGVFSLSSSTQDGLLGQLSTVYLDRLAEDYLETYRQRVRALTAEDVLLTARRYLDSKNAQIVVVGDRALIGEQAALFGELETYDAHGNRLGSIF